MILLKEDAEKVQQALTRALGAELDKLIAGKKQNKALAHGYQRIIHALPIVDDADLPAVKDSLNTYVSALDNVSAVRRDDYRALLARFNK